MTTIDLSGPRSRLWGIDAPEMGQTSGNWAAGVAATYALADLMRGKAITCELRGHDRYGRAIGLCRANGEDLGAAMVSAGMAWAFTRYSSDYISQERIMRGQADPAAEPGWARLRRRLNARPPG